MAVGRGSMERAAKAAERTEATVKKPAGKADAPARKPVEKKSAEKVETPDRKPVEKKTAQKMETPVRKSVEKTAAPAAEKACASKDETSGQIIYQKSSGMLERDAVPNEIFGLGDAMPVYYF